MFIIILPGKYIKYRVSKAVRVTARLKTILMFISKGRLFSARDIFYWTFIYFSWSQHNSIPPDLVYTSIHAMPIHVEPDCSDC